MAGLLLCDRSFQSCRNSSWEVFIFVILTKRLLELDQGTKWLTSRLLNDSGSAKPYRMLSYLMWMCFVTPPYLSIRTITNGAPHGEHAGLLRVFGAQAHKKGAVRSAFKQSLSVSCAYWKYEHQHSRDQLHRRRMGRIPFNEQSNNMIIILPYALKWRKLLVKQIYRNNNAGHGRALSIFLLLLGLDLSDHFLSVRST